MNLVVNASDAMPDGGTITLAAHRQALDEGFCRRFPWARPGVYGCLEVRDEGRGVPEEIRTHLFEPYVTTKPPQQGGGLGLSIVYSIVKNHRGYVHFESEPGSGTVFRVFLPGRAGEPRAAGASTAGRVGPEVADRSVLVVEDEQVIRDLAATALRSLGHRVLSAASTEEATEIFEREGGNVDLLFTDVVLGGGSGVDLADALRSRRSDLRVLFTTGYSGESVPGSASPGGRCRLIQKPYTLHLVERVRDMLS